jgi:hypothetical protein
MFPQDLRIGGVFCDDFPHNCRELSAFGPIMGVTRRRGALSKLLAGLAFSQPPLTSAGLAQRLLPHYYDAYGSNWPPRPVTRPDA